MEGAIFAVLFGILAVFVLGRDAGWSLELGAALALWSALLVLAVHAIVLGIRLIP